MNNKKIDGELYALLLTYSYGSQNQETVIYKNSLPSQATMCTKLGIKSPKTLRAHMAYLIETGYLIDNDDHYIVPRQEDIYFMIPLDTLQFLTDVLQEQVIKVYIYLGQRFKFKPGYIFTVEEIGEHIGIQMGNNQRNYDMINNALVCLAKLGLIKYTEFFDGTSPRKRLIGFSLECPKM